MFMYNKYTNNTLYVIHWLPMTRPSAYCQCFTCFNMAQKVTMFFLNESLVVIGGCVVGETTTHTFSERSINSVNELQLPRAMLNLLHNYLWHFLCEQPSATL